jgi:glycosyltransferase involved in cell wall biosynthesis
VRFHPDVVWSHFLVPAGAWAAAASLAGRAPLVMTAHGQDVRNIGAIPGVRALTALAVRRADTVIAVSDHLRRALVAEIPAAGPKAEVIDSGVDLDRFAPADQAAARRRLGWEDDGPHLLFVGRLDDRKNVLRLAEAFERLGRGTLAMVGDGPLRDRLEGRPGVRLVGTLPHDRVAEWMQACDVLCLPSSVEPFGQVLLEALACERSVVATRVGGPPEFVTPEAGVLVDPGSVDSIAEGLRRATELPSPNPAARRAAAEHGLERQAERVEAVLRRAVDRHRRRV